MTWVNVSRHLSSSVEVSCQVATASEPVNRRGGAQVRVSTRLRKYAEIATTRHVHSAETVTTSAALAAETDEASKEVLSPQTRDGPS